ncbi:pupal cuticle protein Edg-78E-like [Scaptodrosophila lebanonensis]|uniref:Pupal cuticle protein Edg-78E-like n=1 Tax=Drosophila lebanonensis TaxID=7225 RepID=A0A6J2UCJ5_DROLE|nr:pupal cuticle protein Edg-78E-like [Scaptodrosophila lebanonensis]
MFRLLLIASIAIAGAFAVGNPSDAYAETVKSNSEINLDNYRYEWQTSNGISAQESGIGGDHATGGFSYYSPEGELVQLNYVADANGFQPAGSHVPTPPPIPAAIIRSLEYIRTHPQYVEPEYPQQRVQQRVQQRAPVRQGQRQFSKAFAG